jgi:carboxylesterase
MARQPNLDPSAFYLQGGRVGALLVHGFTGSPPEMRPVGDYLHQRGLTVSAPLLPGHGTTVEEMNRSKWTDWTTHVEKAYEELLSRCDTAFVAGLSMGAVLTLNLVAARSGIPGIVLYAPAVWPANRLLVLTPILKYFIKKMAKDEESDLTDPEAEQRIWSYEENPGIAGHEFLKLLRRVRRALPQVTQPLLIIYSTLDSALLPTSATRTFEQVGSDDKELIELNNSGHVLTADSEREFVAQKTYEFIVDHLPEGVEI